MRPVTFSSNNNPGMGADWSAVGSGLAESAMGTIKMVAGASVVVAAGGIEVFTGGAATPGAIPIAIAGAVLTVDGFVQATIGLAKTVDALFQGDVSEVDVPNSMSEMMGIAGDEAVEVVTGEPTDTLQNVGRWVGSQPAGVVNLFLSPQPLGTAEEFQTPYPEF